MSQTMGPCHDESAAHPHHAESLERVFGRRKLLVLGAGALGMATLGTTLSGRASAQPPPTSYEAMLLMCIDPRFVNPTNVYMQQRNLINHYSQFALAGAAAGVVAPHWESWHQTFWENLAASIELHGINGVIAMDHRDCGAVKIAYGDASIATPEIETQTHEMILGQFRDGVKQRHPHLYVETWLMDLGGAVQEIGP